MTLLAPTEQTKEKYDYPTDKLGTVEVLLNNQVLSLLKDKNFISDWNQLYHQCPWGTVFQSSAFVCAWYEYYADKHTPIIVLSRYQGKLTGLISLASGIPKLGIAGAGGWDAYYQTWLTSAIHGEVFIKAALKALKRQFPSQDIFFKYIPPGTPTEWLKTDSYWKNHNVSRTFSRPLMNMGNPSIDKHLKKKQFKEQCNKLKRLGKINYETVYDVETLRSIIDQLADQYDFRKAATLNLMPFREDKSKKQFLIELFQRGLLITTVLKLNDNIIAALVATIGKDGWVHGAGINTHAPAYSTYSPGYVIMQMLGLKLMQEGIAVLDLTPGGHSYKERHANDHDEVLELHITSKIKSKFFNHFYNSKEAIKILLQERGINPRRVSHSFTESIDLIKERFKASGNAYQILKSILGYSIRNSNPSVFRLSISNETVISTLNINKDSLSDLLCYSPEGYGISRWDFMKNVMRLYDSGLTPFTYCNNDTLICLVWHGKLSPRLKARITLDNTFLSDQSILLYGLYCHNRANNKIQDFLYGVATMLGEVQNSNNIYLTNLTIPKSIYKQNDCLIKVI